MSEESTNSTPVAKKPKVKLPKGNHLGRVAYSDKHLAKEFSLPIVKQGEMVRGKWANTALVLAERAKKASQTYGKKDFNALYRLVLSASIAMDKAFPQQVQPLSGNLIVNLFSGLGQSTVSRILEPEYPKVEVVVEATEVETPSDKPLDEPE